MSDSVEPQGQLSLEFLRKLAKQTLKRLRAGDQQLLGELRKQIPALSVASDGQLAAEVKLGDIHQALARQRGFASWAKLKRHVESLQPLDVQAGRFLKALRSDDLAEAQSILAEHPGIAEHDIYCAAALGNDKAVERFLAIDPALANEARVGENRNSLLYLSLSPFHTLSPEKAAGSAVCARLLLAAGADANSHILWDDADPESKLSALYYACNVNNVDVVELLLLHGADPNDGESIYHAAEHNHRECLELLLEHGGDIGSRHPHWDNTPLYFLAGYKEFHPSCPTTELGMRWLLEHGADPNIPSITVPAVVSHATGAKHAERFETPLHRIAAYGRSAATAQMLLDYGAQVDAARADGRTPYVMAVRSGNLPVADLLASRGADATKVTAVDRILGALAAGDAAHVSMLARQHPGLLSELDDEDRQALAFAAEEGRLESVRLMVELGFDLRWEHEWGGTPLHMAAWHGRPDVTKLLLELGAPVNVRESTYGSSPLAWAAHGSLNCRKGHDDDYCAVIELLLDAGADRETSLNKWNEPPEQLGSKAVVALLQERGFVPG